MTDTATPTEKPTSSSPTRSRRSFQKRRRLANQAMLAITAAAAVAAAFAPASLTGHSQIDMIERMAFAALLAYTAAHGHRWSWFAGAAFILVPARGVSLGLVVLATLVAMWATTRPARPKPAGALVGALLANACLWYSAEAFDLVLIVLCAVVGSAFLVVSGFRSMKSAPRRSATVPLLIGLAVLVVGVLGVVVGGLLSASDLTAGTSAARKALTAVENGDTESARLSLESAQEHLDRADGILGPSTLVARVVPSLAQHVNALDVALTESRNITRAADDLLASADYEKLRYQGRVDVEQIRLLAPGATDVHKVLATAQGRLAEAQTSWLVGPLNDRVQELHDEIADVSEATDLASQVLAAAPGLFGADGDRRYLIVFLTPAELRGGGGFIGSYAELLARDGRVSLADSGPIPDLIKPDQFGERTLAGPVDYVRRYGRFSPADYVQDIPYSPHFPYNAEVLAQVYPQAGGSEVDGVIGIDPIGLAALLELTGPVQVEGYDQPLSAENAADFLTRDQYVQFSNYGDRDGTDETRRRLEDERKDFLAAATKATFEELTRANLPAPAEIGAALGPAARGRHLQVWSPNQAEQALFERVDADSALDIPDGVDGFEVVQHNAGNNKIDGYLKRTIEYTAEVDPATGGLSGKLKVTLHNDIPHPRLPPAILGNRAGVEYGTSITWLSLFTHHQVVKATVDGAEISLGQEEEVGLNAFDTPFISIPPMGSVVVEFELEGGVDLSEGYELMVMPQPVANPDVLEVAVGAKGGKLVGPDSKDGAVVYSGPMTEPVTATADLG